MFTICSAKVEGVHKEFQKTVRAGVCRFIPETGNLMMITLDESSQKRARMIQEMHFRNLSQKVCDYNIDNAMVSLMNILL